MNARPALKPVWSRERFWCVAGVLFVLQAGLIVLLAERGPKTTAAGSMPGNFRLVWTRLTADQLSKTFFAADPTVYPLPGLHGFSERAWLDAPEPQYEAPNEIEEPEWLAPKVASLGTNFPLLARSESALPPGLPKRQTPDSDAWPAFLPPEQFKTNSVCELRGRVNGRQIEMPDGLKAWPSAFLLSNTVVQIGVNSAGQVIATRLLSRSGLVDADSQALEKARRMRFRPSSPAEPVWGRMIFEWQTAEPTNVGPANEP